jgi:sulfate transport system ATP-binding protein
VLDGNDLTEVPPQTRGIGMVFQSYALFKHMTVRDNIGFGLSVRKRTPREVAAKVDELIALVRLDGLADRFPAQLSGGQRQRVALARALAIEPRLLLLDEPFAALDSKVRVELREHLRELHQRTHVTTLLVTHDQEEALELSQHIVVMHEGRVAQAGAPQEVYDQPATPFVAQFVGGANILPGRDGSSALAFVRPHDVKIKPADQAATEAGDGDHVAMGKIERLAVVGGYVKVSLKLADGAPMTVEMPRTEIESLGVAEGDRVLIDLREAKVFVEDFSI